MLHNYCIFTCILHNFCIFTCISAQVLYFSPVSFTISLFFTHVSAKLLYFHLCFSSIFVNPNIWKATVFIKYIPRLCFATVFYKCISPQVESCACEAARLPTGRPVATGCLGVGTGHSWKWAQATDWASVSGLLKLSPQAAQDISSFLRTTCKPLLQFRLKIRRVLSPTCVKDGLNPQHLKLLNLGYTIFLLLKT